MKFCFIKVIGTNFIYSLKKRAEKNDIPEIIIQKIPSHQSRSIISINPPIMNVVEIAIAPSIEKSHTTKAPATARKPQLELLCEKYNAPIEKIIPKRTNPISFFIFSLAI